MKSNCHFLLLSLPDCRSYIFFCVFVLSGIESQDWYELAQRNPNKLVLANEVEKLGEQVLDTASDSIDIHREH